MAGKGLIEIEIAALGLVGVVVSEIAARLALTIMSMGSSLALIAHAGALAAAIALAVRPRNCTAPFVLAILWVARAGWGFGDAFYNASDLTLWVSAAEAATIATAMLKLTARHSSLSQAIEPAARIVASVMLLLFAYVHLLHPQAITQLIPAFFPARPVLPLMSGCVMAAAALSLWAPALARPASLIVANIFMAWIPLIHAPRLSAGLASPLEWRFAFMALCLAGCLIVIGREELGSARAAQSASRSSSSSSSGSSFTSPNTKCSSIASPTESSWS